jgi:hypothetical protein
MALNEIYRLIQSVAETYVIFTGDDSPANWTFTTQRGFLLYRSARMTGRHYCL